MSISDLLEEERDSYSSIIKNIRLNVGMCKTVENGLTPRQMAFLLKVIHHLVKETE